MVIRVLSVPDDTELTDPHEIFQVLMDLMRAKKRRGFGWKRRSRAWLYTTLGLYQDYRIRPVGHA